MTKAITKVGQIYRQGIGRHIKTNIESKGNIFLVSYSKVSSMQMDNLRKAIRRAGGKLYVTRNRIAQRTLGDLKFEQLAERFKGQMAFVWCEADSVEISKALTKFAKECEGVKVKGGLLDGKILEEKDVKRLSDLPSREVLLTMLLGAMQAPLSGFVGALTSKQQELLSILKQLSEKGGK